MLSGARHHVGPPDESSGEADGRVVVGGKGALWAGVSRGHDGVGRAWESEAVHEWRVQVVRVDGRVAIGGPVHERGCHHLVQSGARGGTVEGSVRGQCHRGPATSKAAAAAQCMLAAGQAWQLLLMLLMVVVVVI